MNDDKGMSDAAAQAFPFYILVCRKGAGGAE